MRNHDEEVILAFVAELGKGVDGGLQVERWPDRENRGKKDIDAIAGQFAIEHTSIDALDEKRARDPRFMKVIGELETELKHRVPIHLQVTVPYRAVAKGQDWPAMQSDLRDWVLGPAQDLAHGHHALDVVLAGVPVRLSVWARHDLGPGLYFARSVDDADLALKDNLARLINEKARKLAPYAELQKERVLLLEGSDIAMLGHVTVAEGIQEVFPNGLPEGVDAVWYADTTLGVKHPRLYHLDPLIRCR